MATDTTRAAAARHQITCPDGLGDRGADRHRDHRGRQRAGPGAGDPAVHGAWKATSGVACQPMWATSSTGVTAPSRSSGSLLPGVAGRARPARRSRLRGRPAAGVGRRRRRPAGRPATAGAGPAPTAAASWRPARWWTQSGRPRLAGGRPVDDGDALVVATSGTTGDAERGGADPRRGGGIGRRHQRPARRRPGPAPLAGVPAAQPCRRALGRHPCPPHRARPSRSTRASTPTPVTAAAGPDGPGLPRADRAAPGRGGPVPHRRARAARPRPPDSPPTW